MKTIVIASDRPGSPEAIRLKKTDRPYVNEDRLIRTTLINIKLIKVERGTPGGQPRPALQNFRGGRGVKGFAFCCVALSSVVLRCVLLRCGRALARAGAPTGAPTGARAGARRGSKALRLP